MYQALYRKYRPSTFEDVVGQESITQTLKAQLVSGKLSHAYLFTGTRGTGKTSCAKILAKAVNCLDLQDGNPCNHCEACHAIDAGSCVDVLEIDAASNNGVEHIRTLRDEAVYSPSQVRKRVYIVDEVHMLSISAFNALLKIIEEPPEHLMFILATTELHKVPATILSRCQRFSFRRLQAADIAARLNYVAYEEGVELDGEAAELLANLADGALRDGLSLLDQCASASAGGVTPETVCRTLGLAGAKNTAAMLSAIGSGNGEKTLELFHQVYEAGKDLSALLGELGTLARDLLILKTAPDSGAGMLSGISTAAEREPLLRQFSPAELLRVVSLVQKTASGFATSANRRLDTELCLLELCNPALRMDSASLSARLGKLEQAIASGSFTVSPAAAPAAEQEPPLSEAPKEETAASARQAPPPEELPSGFWPEFYEKIKGSFPVQVYSLLAPEGAVHPEYREHTIYLNCSVPELFEKAIGTDTLRELARVASSMLGSPVQVRLKKSGAAGAGKDDPMASLQAFCNAHQNTNT